LKRLLTEEIAPDFEVVVQDEAMMSHRCGRWIKDQTAKLNFTSTLDCESAEIHDHIEIYSPLLGVPGFFQKT